MRLAVAAAAAPLVLLALAPAAAQEPEGGAMIHVVDHRFVPADVNSTGGGVTLMSFGPSPHTFTADDGSFRVELPAVERGNWTEHALTLPVGDHAYHCEYHPNMTGIVRVRAAAPAGPTQPTPTVLEDPGFEAALAVAALAGVALLARRGRRGGRAP